MNQHRSLVCRRGKWGFLLLRWRRYYFGRENIAYFSKSDKVCLSVIDYNGYEDMFISIMWYFNVKNLMDFEKIHRKKASLSMLYKYNTGTISVNSLYLPTLSGPLNSNTRKTHDIGYDLPYHRTQYRKTSFFQRTIATWNSLSQEVVSATTLDSASSEFYKHPSHPLPSLSTAPNPTKSHYYISSFFPAAKDYPQNDKIFNQMKVVIKKMKKDQCESGMAQNFVQWTIDGLDNL